MYAQIIDLLVLNIEDDVAKGSLSETEVVWLSRVDKNDARVG